MGSGPSIAALPEALEVGRQAIAQAEAKEAEVEAMIAEGGDPASSFAGLGWSIGNVPLGFDFETTMSMAKPGQRLETKKWAAKSGTVFDAPIAPRTDFEAARFGITDISAVTDRTVVTPTHWHSGNMVMRVSREVRSSKPELMPTPENLIAATKAKFGPNPQTDLYIYGQGGIGQENFQIMAYPIKNGQPHAGACFRIDMTFGQAMKPVDDKYAKAKDVLKKIETGNHCDASVVVMYSKGRMGRVRTYRVIARDFLMDARNYVTDIDTKLRLLEEHEAQMPKVAPKL